MLAIGPAQATPRCPGGDIGRVAYVRAGTLYLLDLSTCRDRSVVRAGNTSVVGWYAGAVVLGDGRVVESNGRVTRPLGRVASVVTAGGALAGITRRGGVVTQGRRLLPEGWGARTLAFSPDGAELAVSRDIFRTPSRHDHQEIWLLNLHVPAGAPVYRVRSGVAPPELAGWWPDGSRILFWSDLFGSASIAADGLPLDAVSRGGQRSRLVGAMLTYPDFLTRCGRRLVVAAGGDRFSTHGKRILAFAPRRVLGSEEKSWVSPACSPDGRFVVAPAGRDHEGRFGTEHRSLFLLPVSGGPARRLTSPPANRSDEYPQWSDDGRFVLFVRSGPTTADASARGALYLLDVQTHRTYGPLAQLRGSNYYGHYSWPSELVWAQGTR